jgi:hypothetical protein
MFVDIFSIAFAIKFFSVMFALFLTDICWTFYLVETAAKKAVPAGMWSAIIIATGAFAITGYIEDHRLIVAAMLGAFLGTYVTLKYKLRKEKRNG